MLLHRFADGIWPTLARVSRRWLRAPGDPANAATAKAVADAAWMVFALTEYNPTDHPASGAVKRFLDASPVDLRNKNLVAIAYNVPYHLDSTEVSKLSAYFAVYNKTQAAIATGFRALFGEATPHGASPVNVSGIFYNVADAVQPDPAQKLTVALFGQPDELTDAKTVPLVAGPVLDRNGNPVPDGATVSFTLAKDDGTTTSASGHTTDGLAGAQVATSGAGKYTATASVGSITSSQLALSVSGSATAVAPTPAPVVRDTGSSDGGASIPLLAWLIGVPSGLAIVAVAAVGIVLYRRRGAPAEAAVAEPAVAAAPQPPPPPPALRVDGDTRRVYVHGNEARPPLSNEQFRLLHYLYERAGKVIGREELVLHVWPDANVEGVSEEALDALVRRVRERIVQAGGERSYIVTLRGQGFRLDV